MVEAYVTLVATDSYASGALVLSHKLRDLGSTKEIVCLVTPNISSHVQDILSKVCTVIPVETIRSTDFGNLNLLGRPELDITFTKIQLWSLTQFSKIVYLDADTFPLKNIDELFETIQEFLAAPDAGWPDCFNSGVFVTSPSESVYSDLIKLSKETGSFDGGDQGLLNTYFSSWSSNPSQRLPFTFNTTPTSQYGYAPAHNQYGHNISILHFIGENKPWKYQRFADGKILPLGGSAWEGLRDMVQEWWNTWDKHFGQTPPYHLLSGNFDSSLLEFDSGFQTHPIVPFYENIKSVWDEQPEMKYDDDRRIVQPMPPVSKITFSFPEWVDSYHGQYQEQQQEKHEPFAHHETQSHQDSHHDEQSHQQDHHHLHQDHRHEGDQQFFEDHDSGSNQHEQHPQNDEGHQKKYHEEHCERKEPYSMIEWDPAHQAPPTTGRLGADIPDLSNFRNVWDQPHQQHHQRFWVAPVHTPEPQVMTRPEYSEYDTNDYDSSILYPQQQYQEEPHHEEYHQEEEHHHHHEEHHHMEESHHHEQVRYNEYQHQFYHENPVFPWDSNPQHFPTPTRIWQDEDYQHYQEYFEGQNTTYDYHQQEHHQHEEEYHHEEVHHYEEEHRHEDNQHQAENDYNHESHNDHTVQQHETKEIINEQPQNIEIPVMIHETLEAEEEVYYEEPKEEQSLFAIDQPLRPLEQNKIDEFIASLVAEDRDGDDFSERDLIPIKFKPSSRLQSGMHTPSPSVSRNISRNNSRSNSRSGSRRASVVSSRRNSVSVINKKSSHELLPTLTVSQDIQQLSKLFANESTTYSKKTPYTSAAVTPAAINSPGDLNRDTYFIDESLMDDDEDEGHEKPDFLELAQYSLAESLEIMNEPAEDDGWDPIQALNKLKEHSENMVLRQSLHEALSRTVKEQENEAEIAELANEPIELNKKPAVFKSSWDDEEYELPSGLISGQSSPRTPVVRSLDDNLSLEIALEKERYKQQRASLQLAQPQAAVASMLEAELDLSQGTLFKRRRYEESSPVGAASESVISSTTNSVELFAGEEPQHQEVQVSFYDNYVVKEAQRKLRALVTGEIEQEDVKKELESIPLPTAREEKFEDPVEEVAVIIAEEPSRSFNEMYNSRKYHANFGFDQKNKLRIYKPELVIPDALDELRPINFEIEIKEDPITRKARIVREEQEKKKLAEKEAAKAALIAAAAVSAGINVAAAVDSSTKSETITLTENVTIPHSTTETTSSDLLTKEEVFDQKSIKEQITDEEHNATVTVETKEEVTSDVTRSISSVKDKSIDSENAIVVKSIDATFDSALAPSTAADSESAAGKVALASTIEEMNFDITESKSARAVPDGITDVKSADATVDAALVVSAVAGIASTAGATDLKTITEKASSVVTESDTTRAISGKIQTFTYTTTSTSTQEIETVQNVTPVVTSTFDIIESKVPESQDKEMVVVSVKNESSQEKETVVVVDEPSESSSEIVVVDDTAEETIVIIDESTQDVKAKLVAIAKVASANAIVQPIQVDDEKTVPVTDTENIGEESITLDQEEEVEFVELDDEEEIVLVDAHYTCEELILEEGDDDIVHRSYRKLIVKDDDGTTHLDDFEEVVVEDEDETTQQDAFEELELEEDDATVGQEGSYKEELIVIETEQPETETVSQKEIEFISLTPTDDKRTIEELATGGKNVSTVSGAVAEFSTHGHHHHHHEKEGIIFSTAPVVKHISVITLDKDLDASKLSIIEKEASVEAVPTVEETMTVSVSHQIPFTETESKNFSVNSIDNQAVTDTTTVKTIIAKNIESVSNLTKEEIVEVIEKDGSTTESTKRVITFSSDEQDVPVTEVIAIEDVVISPTDIEEASSGSAIQQISSTRKGKGKDWNIIAVKDAVITKDLPPTPTKKKATSATATKQTATSATVDKSRASKRSSVSTVGKKPAITSSTKKPSSSIVESKKSSSGVSSKRSSVASISSVGSSSSQDTEKAASTTVTKSANKLHPEKPSSAKSHQKSSSHSDVSGKGTKHPAKSDVSTTKTTITTTTRDTKSKRSSIDAGSSSSASRTGRPSSIKSDRSPTPPKVDSPTRSSFGSTSKVDSPTRSSFTTTAKVSSPTKTTFASKATAKSTTPLKGTSVIASSTQTSASKVPSSPSKANFHAESSTATIAHSGRGSATGKPSTITGSSAAESSTHKTTRKTSEKSKHTSPTISIPTAANTSTAKATSTTAISGKSHLAHEKPVQISHRNSYASIAKVHSHAEGSNTSHIHHDDIEDSKAHAHEHATHHHEATTLTSGHKHSVKSSATSVKKTTMTSGSSGSSDTVTITSILSQHLPPEIYDQDTYTAVANVHTDGSGPSHTYVTTATSTSDDKSSAKEITPSKTTSSSGKKSSSFSKQMSSSSLINILSPSSSTKSTASTNSDTSKKSKSSSKFTSFFKSKKKNDK